MQDYTTYTKRPDGGGDGQDKNMYQIGSDRPKENHRLINFQPGPRLQTQ